MPCAIIDTDILSEILKQRNATIQRRALAYLSENGFIAFSVVTRLEMLRGILQRNSQRLLQNFETFCGRSIILPVTTPIFDRAAHLWVEASQRGFSRNDADLLIAASALENGCQLVTGNQRHFSWIEGLELQDWRSPL
jgi:tRNA(fMet)-specific endonuclease VapC